MTDAQGRTVEYQSRRARKGRYKPQPHHVYHEGKTKPVFLRVPKPEIALTPHLIVDVSFWVAATFTFGSAVWVVYGFLAWLPFIYPWVGRNAIAKTASAMAFIGGVFWVLGGYLMVVEALDRGRETDLGTALEHVFTDHPQPNERRGSDTTASSDDAVVAGKEKQGKSPGGTKRFKWWGKPMWHDMGYMAAFSQFVSAIIYWVPCLTGLPGVIPGLDEGRHLAVAIVLYWTPQVVGYAGFVYSSGLLMLEVQKHWWEPNFFDIGWQSGVWNMIGSWGFLLCGAFGFSRNSGMMYQSALATFWGAWAFLIGSCCQLVEVTFREAPD